MAVVQISRIQHRRGRKNAGSGLPQLASGELGWAVDSQELFIGNGAVSEGAPQVGNTKILTEHDNLFDFAATYTYEKNNDQMQTGAAAETPVERTLQERLDEVVNGKSFGLTGDGSDQTVALQRALDQLYLNFDKTDTASRTILHIDAGTYLISSTVYIPPFATIRGAGIDKTVFRSSGDLSGPMFHTITSTSSSGNRQFGGSTVDQARKIDLGDFTCDMVVDNSALLLESCTESFIHSIKFKGPRFLGDPLDETTGIKLRSTSTLVSSNYNTVSNCVFENLSYGIESSFDIQYNTVELCRFETLAFGINFGKDTTIGLPGQVSGPSNNKCQDCLFNFIQREAVIITEGTKNIFTGNRFISVGNDGGIESNATYSVFNFSRDGNTVIDSVYDRSIALGYDPANIINVPFVPEVAGPHFENQPYTHNISLTSYGQYSRLFRLPANKTVGYTLNYLYESDGANAMRQGTMSIVYNQITDSVELVDDFDYSGDAGVSENLQFRASVSDEDGDGTTDTVIIEIINSSADINAKLQYAVQVRV